MAVYTWRGRNNRGEAVNGQLEAMTEGGVADQLLSIGVAPVHIALAQAPLEDKSEGLLARLNAKPVVVEAAPHPNGKTAVISAFCQAYDTPQPQLEYFG